MSEQVGSTAGSAYSQWAQTIDGTARALSTGNVRPNSTDSTTWAKQIRITAESAWCRFRYYGAAPASGVGHILTAGDTLILAGADNIANFQAIAGSSGNSTLQVTAER